MGKLLVKLVDYFFHRKVLFLLSLALILIFLGLGISKLNISEDIFSALPKGKDFEKLNKLLENNNVSNQAVFSININPSDNNDVAHKLALEFSDSLKIYSSGLLREITSERPEVEHHVYQFLYSGFPYFIDKDYYTRIAAKVDPDSIDAEIAASYNRLISPGSAFMKEYILNDPLSITGEYFETLNSNNNPQGIIVEDGLVYTQNKKNILITARTSYSARNSANNIILHNKLQQLILLWNNHYSKNKADYFGTFEVAAENAIQVKKDTRLTLFITLFLILLILIIYYRKLLIPVYFIMPAVFGAIFAAGLMGYVRPEISAISLATSAILLGIILDYSFHFFTHLKHTQSITETIKDISAPLLVGSSTTIIALAALNFAGSPILQDFGLFAAFSLSGAAIFTLVGLPVFLKIFSFNYTSIPDAKFHFRMPVMPDKLRLASFIFIIIITVFFYHSSQNIQFDSDLENLSFHTQNLKDKEQELAGIDPACEKKIYLFVSDSDYQKASEVNFEIFENIKKLKHNSKIKSYVSSGQFIIPEIIKHQRGFLWDSFWYDRKVSIEKAINNKSAKLGFSKNAFANFYKWVKRDKVDLMSEDSLLKLIGINNLVGYDNGKYTYITTVVVKSSNMAVVKAQLKRITGAEIFDRSETAGILLSTVKRDFNYILFISAGIVFFTLLIIFGRIELTLLAFFPMVISWIWILGIAALFNIQFNFVNVVISTFIFGLGDDFSIFVTDGLLNKYKYRKDSLSSYTSAIILSALCTIIGTGVLFFAKHPAIHSVAAISVLGIICILFLSLIFQPILFDFFVLKRIARKKPPVTFIEFIMSIFCLTYFIVGCISFYPIVVILVLLPLNKKFKTRLLNKFISFFSKTVIFSGLHSRKCFMGKENLDLENKPAIIIANHTSFLDIMLILLLSPRIIIMVKDWVHNSILFGFCVRYAGYIYAETAPKENLEKIKERMADGYSLMIFPEGTRSSDGKLKRFHKGAFYLSKELNVDIIPVMIEGAYETSPKGNFLIRSWFINLKILPRIKAEDMSWGSTYQERNKSITTYFKAEYIKFTEEKETSVYMWEKVFHNYVFKGPLIEWYGRIKWKLEFNNYQYYHELIGERNKILDIGCGYGFFALFLHFKNRNRVITAIDYDDEKIAIAANVYDKTDHLNYITADVREFEFVKRDVIILNDILHYLTEYEQETVLQRCYEALNSDGIILIRDGITNLHEKHKATKLSEFFSTRILGFNKKKNEFHFFSSEYMLKFAQNNGLNLTMMEQSKRMSNVLFILRKM